MSATSLNAAQPRRAWSSPLARLGRQGQSHATLDTKLSVQATIVISLENLCRGILNVRHVGTWAVATYSVIFGLIAGLHFGLDAIKLARRYSGGGRRCREEAAMAPPAPAAGSEHAADGSSARKLAGKRSASTDSSNGV